MATDLENLLARRATICRNIAALNEKNFDTPNATGGTEIDYVGKIDAWYRELEKIDSRISAMQDSFEVTSEACP